MKNIGSIVLSLLSIVFISTVLFTSCNDDDPVECCTGFDVVTKSYAEYVPMGDDTVWVTGSVTIYTGFTPLNKHFCDSMVWDDITGDYQLPYDVYDPVTFTKRYDLLCSPEEALEKYLEGCRSCCPCRKNPDTAFNISASGEYFNDKFVIEGIDSFPNNRLYIRVPGDTSKIREFVNYDNISLVFEGQVTTDSTLYGRNPVNKLLQSGKYEYELILFPPQDTLKMYPLDTIIGNFCIIRTDDFENLECVGFEAGDPLIK